MLLGYQTNKMFCPFLSEWWLDVLCHIYFLFWKCLFLMLYVDKSFFMFRDRDGTEKIPLRKKSQDYRCSMVPQSGWKNNGHFYNSFIAATVNEFVYYRTNNPPVLDIPMILLNCQFITNKTPRYPCTQRPVKVLELIFVFFRGTGLSYLYNKWNQWI